MTIKFRINEIFQSIQGEGRYVGLPVIFIRLSGCNLKCSWCDTKYHEKVNYEVTPKELSDYLADQYIIKTIVWTGGEPMLQKEAILEFLHLNSFLWYHHHLETNGIIRDYPFFSNFEYIAFSPKSAGITEIIANHYHFNPPYDYKFDIKVVTDLFDIGVDMIENATMLMPLSFDIEGLSQFPGDVKAYRILELEMKQEVWDYCVENNLRYSPRLHVDIWGLKKREV